MAGRADRLRFAAAAAQLRVVGGEVGVLGADGGLRGTRSAPRSATWGRGGCVPTGCGRQIGGGRGTIPAQDAKCPAVGNRLMSRPHSAISTWAVRCATPGIVHSSSTVWAKGREHRVDLFVEGVRSPGRACRCARAAARPGSRDGRREAVGERLLQLRDLRAHPGLGQLGQLLGIGDAGQQRFEHRARGLRVGLRGDAGELDPGVLQNLLQPLDRAGRAR